MTIHSMCAPPDAELGQALASFEAQFVYPLGPGRFFRISHGTDYPRFYRAIGEAACFAIERQGTILGTLGIARRSVHLPSGEECPAIYVGDLKIAPAARGGRVLVRLAEAALPWGTARANAAFGVVMDGTPITPTRYTGRLGVPAFREIGKVIVLRIPTVCGADISAVGRQPCLPHETAEGCYQRLSKGRYACAGGTPAERSEIEPFWLTTEDGLACGRLEDTCRAKRLIADDGTEMRSAHLSCFAYNDLQAGVRLLRSALVHAEKLGFPALFVALAPPDAAAVNEALGSRDIVAAPATIYGLGFAPGPFWNINTAEI